MEKKYYLYLENEQKGPFSIEEIKNQELENDTPIWCQGMDSWKKLKDVDELKNKKENSPPPYTGFEEEKVNTLEKVDKKKKPFILRVIKLFAILITILVLISITSIILFNQFANKEIKRELYDTIGIDSPSIIDYTVYIELTGSVSKKMFSKSWIAIGSVTSSHQKKTFHEVTIRFHFSDGFQDEVFYKSLSPNDKTRKLWSRTIRSHRNAYYERMEVIDVK